MSALELLKTRVAADLIRHSARLL